MKEFFGAAAVALTLVSFAPYLRSIAFGRTKPHVFSWIVWGATTCIVFFAQLQDGAGIGAWPTGVSGAATVWVAVLAYRQRGDRSVTTSDWVFLVLALTSLPLWYLTADPFWAVLILTTVDLLGFGPSIRKAYHFPFEEDVVFYSLFGVRSALQVVALEHYSWTTVLFPAATGAACLLFAWMVSYRRRRVGPPANAGE